MKGETKHHRAILNYFRSCYEKSACFASPERMLAHNLMMYIIAGSQLSRRPGSKNLAHKMASDEKKSAEEKVLQTKEKTDIKKHRGIPEALFLVSIYLFTDMALIFVDST